MARTKEPTVQGTLRLPVSLWKRAEQLAAKLTDEDTALSYSRVDAIRIILDRHLPPLESTETSAEGTSSKAGSATDEPRNPSKGSTKKRGAPKR